MPIIPHINKQDGIKPGQQENTHHIVARHEGGSNIPYNKIKLYENIHEALHRLFGTLPPHEQISRIIDISQSALSDNFVDGIDRMTSKNKQRIYKKGIRQ